MVGRVLPFTKHGIIGTRPRIFIGVKFKIISVKFRIVQDVLNEILQIPGGYSLQFLVIQKKPLAPGEGATVVWIRGRHLFRLFIQNHI